MTHEEKQKLGILFELGEVRATRADWLDYSQYGIGSEDVDALIRLATDPSLHGAPNDSNDVWVPLHAWRALGQLGDSRAVEPLIGAFDTLCDDDWAAEELPIVLAMIGDHAIGPLEDFLGDRSHAEFAQMMAADALEKIAERHPSTRDRIVEILTDYLDHPDPRATGLNAWAVNALINLEARESIETLRGLYRSRHVDLSVCGDIEDVEIELGLRTQRSKPRPDLTEILGISKPTPVKRDKIGRNDPCPCGSGKKYKKCCLQ
jgi:HEAT repeat protein